MPAYKRQPDDTPAIPQPALMPAYIEPSDDAPVIPQTGRTTRRRCLGGAPQLKAGIKYPQPAGWGITESRRLLRCRLALIIPNLPVGELGTSVMMTARSRDQGCQVK